VTRRQGAGKSCPPRVRKVWRNGTILSFTGYQNTLVCLNEWNLTFGGSRDPIADEQRPKQPDSWLQTSEISTDIEVPACHNSRVKEPNSVPTLSCGLGSRRVGGAERPGRHLHALPPSPGSTAIMIWVDKNLGNEAVFTNGQIRSIFRHLCQANIDHLLFRAKDAD